MNSMTFNNMSTQSDFILDETMLQMPIKRSKQLQDLLKLRIQEKRLIEQAHSKVRALKESNQLPSQKNPAKKPSKSVSSIQKELKMNQSNSSYVVSCIMRALRYRKLAIDDVGDIFGVDGQTVQQIDRFRRIQQLQSDGNPPMNLGSHKFDIKRDKLMKQLNTLKFSSKSSFDNRFGDSNFGHNNHSSSSSSLLLRKNKFSSLYNSRVSHTSRANTLSNYELSSIIESAQKQQQEQNLFQYQKLLKNKPPHKLDDKVRAIVQVLKKHPNIMQKQIIKILQKDYNITGMTQTSISRYYKRIYEMRKHCEVILKAKRDGFVDI